jgi:hypothetical protein
MSAKKAQLPKNSTKIRAAIIRAALTVAANEPWEFVSPLTIAEEAGIELDVLQGVFLTKQDIVKAIIDDLDAQVEQASSVVDDDVSVRDRLFDILMERIELANQDRDAHISFLKAFGWTKEAACSDIRFLMGSMTRMAKCAGIDTEGLFGGMRVGGLAVAYSWVLMTWMRDTSPDLGKTMAELDRTLVRAEGLADYLNIQS